MSPRKGSGIFLLLLIGYLDRQHGKMAGIQGHQAGLPESSRSRNQSVRQPHAVARAVIPPVQAPFLGDFPGQNDDLESRQKLAPKGGASAPSRTPANSSATVIVEINRGSVLASR